MGPGVGAGLTTIQPGGAPLSCGCVGLGIVETLTAVAETSRLGEGTSGVLPGVLTWQAVTANASKNDRIEIRFRMHTPSDRVLGMSHLRANRTKSQLYQQDR